MGGPAQYSIFTAAVGLATCPLGTMAAAEPAPQTRLQLSGLELGESLSDARRAFSAAGRQIVRVTNVTFVDPYELDNLINERGEIYGNIGVCHGHLTSILIAITSYDQLMQNLRQRLSQYGQPEIAFGMIQHDDDSTADEEVTFSWPTHYFQISYPARSGAAQGSQALISGTMCELPPAR